MSSAFGGLLFLQSPKGDSGSITVNLHNVVLTPTYDLMDPNRAQLWQYRRQHASGLWADIAGQNIVFNLPTKSVTHLDHSQLDRVLRFWDSIVLAHHDLRGTKPTHRERIVCDEQPSAGYMRKNAMCLTFLINSSFQIVDILLSRIWMSVIRNRKIFYSMLKNWKRKVPGVYFMNLVIICNKVGGVSSRYLFSSTDHTMVNFSF